MAALTVVLLQLLNASVQKAGLEIKWENCSISDRTRDASSPPFRFKAVRFICAVAGFPRRKWRHDGAGAEEGGGGRDAHSAKWCSK